MEFEQIEAEVERRINHAYTDMSRAGIGGVLSFDYQLDYRYMPNVWRFSLYHNSNLIFASEFILDATMTPNISQYENDSIKLTLIDDFVDAMDTYTVVPFINKRYMDGITSMYTRLESN